MAPRLLCFSPSPSELVKTDRSPEHVCGEVLGAEKVDSHCGARSCDCFDVIDQGATVQDEPGISAHPGEENSASASADAPDNVTDAITIVPTSDHASLGVHTIEGLAGYPAKTHPVDHARVVRDLENLVQLVGL